MLHGDIWRSLLRAERCSNQGEEDEGAHEAANLQAARRSDKAAGAFRGTTAETNCTPPGRVRERVTRSDALRVTPSHRGGTESRQMATRTAHP